MKDKLYKWIAFKLPRCLVEWCGIRIVAYATTGEYSSQVVPDLKAMEAMQRWTQGWNHTA